MPIPIRIMSKGMELLQGHKRGSELLTSASQGDLKAADEVKGFLKGKVKDVETENILDSVQGGREAREVGYEIKDLGRKYSLNSPPYMKPRTYEEIGYDLPDANVNKDLYSTSHFEEDNLMHVRRDQTPEALRVFEMQSDPLNLQAELKGKGSNVPVGKQGINYFKDMINDQFATASYLKKDYVDFLIKPSDTTQEFIQRGDSTQKTYETTRTREIMAQAKKIGATIEKVNVEMPWNFPVSPKTTAALRAKSDIMEAFNDLPKSKQEEVEHAIYENTELVKGDSGFKSQLHHYANQEQEADEYLRVVLPKATAGGAAAISLPVFAEDEDYETRKSDLLADFEAYKAKGASDTPKAQYVLDMLKQGIGAEGITAHLNEREVPQEDIDKALKGAAELYKDTVLEAGGTAEDIANGLRARAYDEETIADTLGIDTTPPGPTTEEQMQTVLDAFVDPKEHDVQEIVSMTENIHSKYSTLYKQAKGYFLNDKKAQNEARMDGAKLSKEIATNLQRYGMRSEAVLNPNTGQAEVLVQDSAGNLVPLDLPLFDSLVEGTISGRAEFGMAVAAGTAAAAATPPLPFIGWLSKPVAGVIAGGAGAALGRGVDSIRNSLTLKLQLDEELLQAQMIESGVADIAFGVMGTAVVGTVAKTFQMAYNSIAKGNVEGGYSALKELLDLSDQQVDDTIAQMEARVGVKVKRGLLGESRESMAMRVIPRTAPGGTNIMGNAAMLKPLSSSKIAKEINNRAQDVMKTTRNMSHPRIGEIVSDELHNYETKVKDFYGNVKALGINEIDTKGTYAFNYDSLAIEPLAKRLQTQIFNSAAVDRLERILVRARELGAYKVDVDMPETIQKATGIVDVKGKPLTTEAQRTVTTTLEGNKLRTFGNLLELRTVVNELAGAPSLRAAAKKNGVDKVMKSIDSEIARVAKNMNQGSEWLKLWKKANTEYSKYKSVQSNVLYKALTAPGKTSQQMVNSLSKHIASVDSTFMEVVGTLPIKTRANVEGSIMDHFVQKYTAGDEGGFRAIHFPMLSRQLEQLTFTTPKARMMKDIIGQYAGVFKNDVNLGAAVDKVSISQFQSFLTTDPVVRAQFAVAKTVFNHVGRLLPGENGRAKALVTHMARLFSNPLEHNSVEYMLKHMPKDADLDNLLHAQRIAYAKFGERSQYNQAEVYRSATLGRALEPSSGPLGRGVYYKVDKSSVTGKGKMNTRTIRPGRIATEQDIRNILGIENVEMKDIANDPTIHDTLIDLEYTGITWGEDVMLFER